MAVLLSPHKKSTRGFTLVELSIVLVIIGLIVGGVLVGRDLIQATELRSIIKEKESYLTAIQQFRERYHALPGDFKDATRFWGAEDADYDNCRLLTTPSTDATTCNGNGNGLIDPEVKTFPAGSDEGHEKWRVWHHLSNAGLIEGKFSGVRGSDDVGQYNLDADVGSNLPESKYGNGAGWSIQHFESFENHAAKQYFVGADYNHAFRFAKGREVSPFSLRDPALTAFQAYSIDEKTDDGKPARGSVVTEVQHPDCHNAIDLDGADPHTQLEAEYKIEDDATESCMLMFRGLPL